MDSDIRGRSDDSIVVIVPKCEAIGFEAGQCVEILSRIYERHCLLGCRPECSLSRISVAQRTVGKLNALCT
jgi:hypothetical protein